MLCAQAAVNAVNGSSALTALFGELVAQGVSLPSAALSAATAAYVASTREPGGSAERPNSVNDRSV